jgi:predicted acylesterase/phospholipase RssA
MRIGLALSGGGFRATLYHLGMVRYLRDAGLLRSVSHITSVSGGSVLAGHLVLNWDRYCGDSSDFDSAAQEVLKFVRLDVRNRIVRRYPLMLATGFARWATRLNDQRPMTRTMLLEKHYQRHLFGDTCLYQLPSSPELHILCTNLSSGGLSSFTRSGLLVEQRTKSGKSTMQLQRVGLATVPMAVAASSAFPGFFPPMELSARTVGALEGEFQTQYFTDGGVYDNLGVRMFHHITQQLQTGLRTADFVDVGQAMHAWNQAAQQQEATPLSRLVEIYTSSPAIGRDNSTGILEEPQEFTRGLNTLLATTELQRDQQLLDMLHETSACDSPAKHDNGSSNGDSNGSSNGDSNGSSDREAHSKRERLARNRQLLQQVFQRTTGQAALRPKGQPFDVILASDAGKKIQVTGSERMGGFLRTALRSSDILMDRVWQLEQDHFKNAKGFIFSPITRIVSQEDDPTAPHPEVQLQISHIRTDMDHFSDREVSGLIRHGYCVIRRSLSGHPKLFGDHQVDLPPWDPTSHPSTTSSQATHTAARPSAAPAPPQSKPAGCKVPSTGDTGACSPHRATGQAICTSPCC